MEVKRNQRSSLYCCCANCEHSIRRSEFDLIENGARAYPYTCELDEENYCFQATACCKFWKKKRKSGRKSGS